jgi:hypothetical protein
MARDGNADKERKEEYTEEDPVDLLCYWSGEVAIMPTFAGAFALRSCGSACKCCCVNRGLEKRGLERQASRS